MSHHPHHCTIIKASHHFVVQNPTPSIKPIIYQLSSHYTQFGQIFDKVRKRKRWGPTKTFAIYVDHGNEFRFHIGQYDEFISAIKNRYIDASSYEIVELPDYKASDVELKTRPGLALRDFQEEARSFICDDMSRENNSPMINVQTGQGKGYVAIFSLAKLGKRFAVIVLAMYVEKWVKELKELLELEDNDLAVIQGSDSLQRCTNYPGSGLDIPKGFVISISTLSNWYKAYEESKTSPQLEAYACMPYDFFERLGIGTVIFDEAHQHPHVVYRTYTYLNVPKTINMTATLLTKDPVLQRVQSMMFPRYKRYDGVPLKRYITSHACGYQIVDLTKSKVQTTEWGQKTYSHVAFERSILKNKNLRDQYINMVINLADKAYYQNRVKDDKLMIFASSRIMAEAILEKLKEKWPALDIRLYMEGNDLKDAIEPDIRVSTVISGGTAIDIPNLRVTIMTISIDSPVSNAQALGRLREMKHREKDNDVHFYYLYCTTIPKHVEYHRNKVELFKSRVLEQKNEFIGTLYPFGSHY